GTAVNSKNRQWRPDRNQITAAQAARNNRTSTGVADGKFPGEYRRVDQRRTTHEYRGDLVSVFLKNSFLHGDEERQRPGTNRSIANRKLLEFLLPGLRQQVDHQEHGAKCHTD